MKNYLSFNEWSKKAFKLLFNNYSDKDIFWDQIFTETVKPSESQMGFFSLNLDELEEPSENFLRELYEKPNWGDFKYFVDSILCHKSDRVYGLSYRLLTKFHLNSSILKNHVDDDVREASVFRKQVGRDIHKMRAFVRFNETEKMSEKYYIAYHKPDHYILKKNANFFKERFNSMNWVIFTPYAVLAWNQKKLFYKEGVFSPLKFPHDPFVNLWKTYFANIFNPARLKIKAMKNEMPVRYWENMPETELIPELIRTATVRVSQMKKTTLEDRVSSVQASENVSGLAELNDKIKICKACSLCELNAKAVTGEGFEKARVVVVGEAPGDFEEKSGRPFVGPAGKLLKETLEKIGVDVSKLFLTNAVKHFNFVQKGDLRVHRTPKTEHTMACRGWLLKEIDLVKPDVLICLGNTAAHSVLGFPMGIESLRGVKHQTSFCKNTFVTYHPSYLLRSKKEGLKEKFFNDLRRAFDCLI